MLIQYRAHLHCMLIHTYRGSSLLQCRIVSCVIGAVLGAYKPVTDGVSLQTGAAALHEEVLKEMSTRNCTLQVRDLHGFEIHHSLQELRICEMCAFWRARDEVLRSLLQLAARCRTAWQAKWSTHQPGGGFTSGAMHSLMESLRGLSEVQLPAACRCTLSGCWSGSPQWTIHRSP